jgi:hypothetical protein
MYPVNFCIVSSTSQSGRVFLNCIDTLVAAQREGYGIASDSCEAVQDDDLVARLGGRDMLCYLPDALLETRDIHESRRTLQ